MDANKKKRKLPDWIVNTEEEEEEEEEEEACEKKRVFENATEALEILENGLRRSLMEKREASLQTTYDITDADIEDLQDEDDFDLSQSSIADVMTSAQALEIMGPSYYSKDGNKKDRNQLICDLKTSLAKYSQL